MPKKPTTTEPIPGFEDLSQIFPEGQYGEVYFGTTTDNANPGGPLGRTIQIVRKAELTDQIWQNVREDVARRSMLLLRAPRHGVLPLLEAGETTDGSLYSVTAQAPKWLRDEIRDREGHPGAAVHIRSITEQLLNGLASLHSIEISFGDLRLEDVRFSIDAATGRPDLWLTGAEFGGLLHCSGAAIMRHRGDDKKRYPSCFPPESRDKPPAPNPRADLYALGLIICQIAGGRLAVDAENGDSKKWVRQIRDGAVQTFVRKHLLAANPQRRAENAVDALNEFGRIQTKRRFLWSVAAVVFALFIIGVPAIVQRARLLDVSEGLHKERMEHAETKEEYEQYKFQAAIKANELTEEIKSLRNALEEAESYIERCLNQIKDIGGPVPSRNGSGTGLSPEEIVRRATRIFNEMARLPLDADIDRWLAAKQKELDSAIFALVEKWIAQMEAQSIWHLSGIKFGADDGSKAAEHWNYPWYVAVEVDGKTYYPASDDQTGLPVEFNWRPGQPITLIVRANDNWTAWGYDTVLMNIPYSDKYGIWQLHKDGQRLSSTMGAKVTFQIDEFEKEFGPLHPDRQGLKPPPYP